jgi:hypothetical protein
MRRLAIAGFMLLEVAIFCGILASSLELSRDLQGSPTVARVAHAVVVSARRIAFAVNRGLRPLA